MSQHEDPDEKTQILEKLDKALKAIVFLTCLAGVVAVAWLCTAGKQKALQTAQQETEAAHETAAMLIETETDDIETTEPETEFVTETKPAVEAESEDDAGVTARVVPAIPYGYEDKTVPETETETNTYPDEDQYAAADEIFEFEFREAWPQHNENPGWYDRRHYYEDRNYDRYEWPSWNEYEFPTREGSIYFFWF